MNQNNKVTTTFRTLSTILLILFIYGGVTLVKNFDKYNLFGAIFTGGIILFFTSIIFTPVIFGRYSYLLKKIYKIRVK